MEKVRYINDLRELPHGRMMITDGNSSVLYKVSPHIYYKKFGERYIRLDKDKRQELMNFLEYILYIKKYFVFSYLGCIVINTPTCNLITDMGLYKNKPEKQKIEIQFESKRKKYTIKLFLINGQIKNSIVIFPNSLYRKTSYIDGVVHKVCVFRIKDNKETGRTEVVQFPIDHKDDLFFKMKDFISNIKRVI